MTQNLVFLIKKISTRKKEPAWLLNFRLAAFAQFLQLEIPAYLLKDVASPLSQIDFNKINYYLDPQIAKTSSWNEVPADVKKSFQEIGLLKAEKKYLAGLGAQVESEMIYHKIQKDLAKKGVIFCDLETAWQKYPKLVKKYFATIVPSSDNKFAALNSAFWSGGSFVYVPPKVKINFPLQAYFKISAQNFGQFERTLIIADRQSQVEYIEGCSSELKSKYSLHAGVVELIALPGSRVRYITLQNWSKNILNLVTKRARAMAGSKIDWIDFNLGSCMTVKYPTILLAEKGARCSMLSLSKVGAGQYFDCGSKVYHLAPETRSYVESKSLSQAGGIAKYRGLVKIEPAAKNSKTKMSCRSLILDEKSQSYTYPAMEIANRDAVAEHEAVTSRISQEQLFYLMSRGLSEKQASRLIINGFAESIIKELPLEYAVEMNRMLEE